MENIEVNYFDKSMRKLNSSEKEIIKRFFYKKLGASASFFGIAEIEHWLKEHILDGYWHNLEEAKKASEKLIERIINAEPIPEKRWQYRGTEEEDIVRSYSVGMSLEWIAKEYGKTIDEIKEILKLASIKKEYRTFFEKKPPPI